MKLYEFFEHKSRISEEKVRLDELNVVNMDTLKQVTDAYANKVTQPEAKAWFQKQVRNFLINNPRDNEELGAETQIDDTSPEWLQKAKAQGAKLFNFKISNETKGELDHIADWLNSEEGSKIMPKLYKVTVPQAVEMSHKWTKAINKKIDTKVAEEGAVDFLDFDDDYRWVILTTKMCLDREGKLMSHCVGSYADKVSSGNTKIYSLRDPKNEPHITVEVTGNSVRQIKGKANQPPENKYIPYVQSFLNKLNVKVDSYDLERMGLMYIDNKLYNMYKLPDGLIIDGNFDFSTKFRHVGPEKYRLPANITVKGNVELKGLGIDSIPENWTISGGLNLDSCPRIDTLPTTLKVGGILIIAQTHITEIPNNLSKLKGLYAARSQLQKLPDAMTIEGALDLAHCPIEHLPHKLACGLLKLEMTKVKELPETLLVTKELDLTNTQVETFPQKYRVASIKGILNSKLTEIPANTNVGDLTLMDNARIERIGENTTFGELKIHKNSKIKALPQKIKCKSLWIDINSEIKEIPTFVGDYLTLTSTAVDRLSPGTKVKELILKNNPVLTTLPPDLEVEERIIVSDKDKALIASIKKSKLADKLVTGK